MNDDEPQVAMDLWDLDAIRFREDGDMDDWSFISCQVAIACYNACKAGDDELRRRRDKLTWKAFHE